MMKTSKILECEKTRIEKMIKFQLPNSFIKIGMGVFIISFLVFIFLKLLDLNSESYKLTVRGVMLISLLVISISKDKDEDEMIKLLRVQSYALAFIIGVVYAVIQPIVNFIVAYLINSDRSIYRNLGDFQVLIFMLMIQLSFFYLLKKWR